MKTSFVPIKLPQEKELLVSFLTTETWPFHVNNQLTSDKVVKMLDDGLFDGKNHESFWILDETKKEVGFIRLFDLEDVDDGYPLFDRKSFRKLPKTILVTIQSHKSKPMFFSSAYIGS